MLQDSDRTPRSSAITRYNQPVRQIIQARGNLGGVGATSSKQGAFQRQELCFSKRVTITFISSK